MPSYTVGNRRITNVPVAGSGEYIQGIRKNTDLGIEKIKPFYYESIFFTNFKVVEFR